MDQDTETLLENFRAETKYFRKAAILKALKEVKKVTTKELARRLGMKASYVCHILRLNKLPEIVRDGYDSKLMSISHLFIIARLKNHDQMMRAYEAVLEKSLTSAQTDSLVREMLYDIREDGTHVSKDVIQELKNKLSDEKNSLDVKVIQTRIKAKIIIEAWGNLEQTSSVIRSITGKIRPSVPKEAAPADQQAGDF